jgi:hypothetical protein
MDEWAIQWAIVMSVVVLLLSFKLSAKQFAPDFSPSLWLRTKRALEFTFRALVGLGLLVGIVWFVGSIVHYEFFPSAEELERRAHIKELCTAKARCAEYAQARQTCAVAGNFELCMSIKVPNVDQLKLTCSPEGTLLSTSKIPTDRDCR